MNNSEGLDNDVVVDATQDETPTIPEIKPGVLDGVENRIVLIFADDGNIQFAIGKACGADRLIQGSFMLNRIANRMITDMEMAQQAEAQRTAAVMRSLSKGGNGGDPWRQGGDRR